MGEIKGKILSSNLARTSIHPKAPPLPPAPAASAQDRGQLTTRAMAARGEILGQDQL